MLLTQLAKYRYVRTLSWNSRVKARALLRPSKVSKRFGFLDAGKDPLNIIDGIDGFLLYAARVGVYPWAHPLLFKVSSLLGTNGFSLAAKFAVDQVHAYKQNVQGETFLAKALRVHQEQPNKISQGDVLNICLMNVMAGSDTTSVSLTSVIWQLLKNPSALQKVSNFLSFMPQG